MAVRANPFWKPLGMGVFVELILAMQDWPKKMEMEQAESRKERFAQALEQLQAISRAYKGTGIGIESIRYCY